MSTAAHFTSELPDPDSDTILAATSLLLDLLALFKLVDDDEALDNFFDMDADVEGPPSPTRPDSAVSKLTWAPLLLVLLELSMGFNFLVRLFELPDGPVFVVVAKLLVSAKDEEFGGNLPSSAAGLPLLWTVGKITDARLELEHGSFFKDLFVD